jgi:UDP-N-acetylglucosamine 4,6-dehydratase
MKSIFGLKGKVVLVTGGTGSFGRFITNQLLRQGVSELRIFSRDEEKQIDMQREIQDPCLTYFIGDIRDRRRIQEAMRGVDIVYHAAALKVIPSCEENVIETIKTNVRGTLNVRDAAYENGVESAVLVSTDKAVKPVNLYGMTKAVAEKLWLERAPKKTNSGQVNYSIVRYGNVVGSRGSIVPFFRKLYAQKEPIPITDLRMTRFMITLEQAINLVFYATGKNGLIFIPKIPAANVVDIVTAICGEGYPTKIVGIRPGEKIHECLINEYEIMQTVYEQPYYVIGKTPKERVLNEEYTSGMERKMSVEEIRGLLKEVPL